MFFKDEENKVTDFIEKNEENISKKEEEKLTLSASDMVDETAKTLVLDTKEAYSFKEEEEKSKQQETEKSKQDIDRKVKEFYDDYKKPYTSHEEYNSSKIKETQPSYDNYQYSPSDIFIRNNMYAGFWVRAFAFLIDLLIVHGIKNIIEYVNLLNTQNEIILGLSFYILFSLYNFIFVYLTNGYTVGKIIMNIKVVSDKSGNIKFTTAFIREFIGKYILMRVAILFFFLVFSPKKHHLIDYLSDTDVIKEKYFSYYKVMG